MPGDYYNILNVGRDASVDELRKAYRARARQLHPDVNAGPDSAAQMAELKTAYDVLRNPQTRAAFDELSTPAAAERPVVETIMDKVANAVDAVLQSDPAQSETEKSLEHFQNMRVAISRFCELPVAMDTARAFLLAAVYEEPARSASMDAVADLYLEHGDARAVALDAAPPDVDIIATKAVVASIVSGAAVHFVKQGLLTTDPPLGAVDHSTQTIEEVATDRLANTFALCGFGTPPRDV